MVKFYDLSFQQKPIEQKFIKFFKKTLKKKDYVLGNELSIFEDNFSKFTGSKFSVGVSNGTDAIFLALKALDISSSDEVIVPSHTFIASVLPIIKCGAKPIFVDVSKNSFLVDFDQIKKKISKKTKAIIVVHLYGEAVNVKKLNIFLKKEGFKIPIIEDASQAHGSMINNLKTGNLGTIGCFSLYPSKNLGALGDAGVITTSNKNLYNKIKNLRNWGSQKKYLHDKIGFNHRMDTIQAGFLNIKLPYIDSWNKERQKIALTYIQNLKNIKGIELPNFENLSAHVFHLFVIKTKYRDKLKNFLEGNNIDTIIHYPTPCHKHLCFKKFSFFKKKFPNSEKLSREILSLPLYPGMSKKNILYICKVVKKFFIINK